LLKSLQSVDWKFSKGDIAYFWEDDDFITKVEVLETSEETWDHVLFDCKGAKAIREL
jgi:hypothetical protein